MEALTPKPYDEGEATVDALGGRAACPHGHWPHQVPVCRTCAAEVVTKVVLTLVGDKAT